MRGARVPRPARGLAVREPRLTLPGMMALGNPARLAAELELDLERYRRAAALVRMPPAMEDLAEALGRIAVMLRDAEDRGQAVDLSDDIVRLIRQFRRTLAAVGGEPARA